MFCTSCGQQIPDGKKFCPKCGAPILIGRGHEGQQETQKLDDPAKEDVQGLHPDGEKGSLKRRPIAIAVVATVLLLTVGAVAFYLGAPAIEGTSATSVTYGSSKAEKVSPDAKIVLYGSNGKKLEDYELTVTNSNGDETTYQISGDSFSPSQVGVTEGKTSFSVKDASTGEKLKTDVVIDESGKSSIEVKPSEDGDSADKSDKTYSGKDEAKGKLTNSEKYALYLEKVEELEAKYGEAQFVEITSYSNAYSGSSSGVGFIDLVDLNGDGFEELVVVHPMEEGHIVSDEYANMSDGQYYLKTLEVWTIDDGALRQVGECDLYPGDAATSTVNIVVNPTNSEIKGLLQVSSFYFKDNATVNYGFVVSGNEEGELEAKLFSSQNESGASGSLNTTGANTTYSIDGTEVSYADFQSEFARMTGTSGVVEGGDAYVLNGVWGEAQGADEVYPGAPKYHSIKDTVDFAKQQKESLKSKAGRK